MQNPNFINCNPLVVMQRLYEIKARQDGLDDTKVIVREISREEAMALQLEAKADGTNG